MTLGELIGPMLGADEGFIYARGSGSEDGEQREEVYARCGDSQALVRSDGVTHVTTDAGSQTFVNGRLVDEGSPQSFRLGHTDTLLHPRHMYVWGRNGEDWRLTEDLKPLDDGTVEVVLQSTERQDSGLLVVDPASGRVQHASFGGLRWTIDVVIDDPTEVPGPMNAHKKPIRAILRLAAAREKERASAGESACS